MPLVALSKQTNERICILDHQDPRLTVEKNGLVCPFCGEPVVIVTGVRRINHFRHKATCSFMEYGSNPESDEHLYAKYQIRESITNQTKGTGVIVDLEVPIPEVKRIADVMVTYPMGWRVAYEIQLSAITPVKLQNRIIDYRNAGVDVVWLFGRHAATESSAIVCRSESCAFMFIEFNDATLEF
jgi:competence CoiA-like predicted nuclease